MTKSFDMVAYDTETVKRVLAHIHTNWFQWNELDKNLLNSILI